VIEKEKCSGGKTGVSGVSNVLLFNCTNGFNQYWWCIYGVSMVYL